MITITGLSQSEWAGIQPNANKHFVPAWRNEEAFNAVCCEDPVTNLLAETFGQHSLLQFPLEVDEIHSSIITMYSRKPDAWHAGHLALLQRMKAELATIIDDGMASTNRYAANGTPKTNPVTPAVPKTKPGSRASLATAISCCAYLTRYRR